MFLPPQFVAYGDFFFSGCPRGAFARRSRTVQRSPSTRGSRWPRGGWGAPWFGAGRVVEGFRKICSWWTSNSWYIFNCRTKRQFVQGCWILGGKQQALRDKMTPTCLMISWNSVCQDLQQSLGGGLFSIFIRQPKLLNALNLLKQRSWWRKC